MLGIAVFLTLGISWRHQVSVEHAILVEQDRLTLLVNTCGGAPELDVLREGQATVEVGVVSTRTYGGSGGSDCQDAVEVFLQAPLGDRRLVDVSTGDDLLAEAG